MSNLPHMQTLLFYSIGSVHAIFLICTHKSNIPSASPHVVNNIAENFNFQLCSNRFQLKTRPCLYLSVTSLWVCFHVAGCRHRAQFVFIVKVIFSEGTRTHHMFLALSSWRTERSCSHVDGENSPLVIQMERGLLPFILKQIYFIICFLLTYSALMISNHVSGGWIDLHSQDSVTFIIVVHL